jgi:hypothetical protein
MNGGMGYLDGTVKTQYNISDYVRAIAVDASGAKWVATGSNLETSRLHKIIDTVRTQYAMTSRNPWAVETDRLGNVWVGFASGLLKFNTALETFEPVGFPGTRVYKLKVDDAQNLWVGSSAHGLLFYDMQAKQWTAYDTGNSGIPSNLVTDIVIEPSGIKWIGTSMGLARYAWGGWEVYDNTNSALESNYIRAVGLESDGRVWVSTYEGLYLFNDSTRSGIEDRPSAVSALLPEIMVSPNPFTGRTAISILLGENGQNGKSVVNIYSVTGRLVRAFPLDNRPTQRVFWDGTDLAGKRAAAGLYFVRIRANGLCFTGSKLLKIQ